MANITKDSNLKIALEQVLLEEFSDIKVIEHEFSPEFKLKMEDIIKSQKIKVKNHSRISSKKLLFVAVIAAMLAITAIGTIAAQHRKKQIISDKYETHDIVSFNSFDCLEISENSGYSDITFGENTTENTTDDCAEIEKAILAGELDACIVNLPEGFVRTNREVIVSMIDERYEFGDKFIKVSYRFDRQLRTYVDNETHLCKAYYNDYGNECFLYYSDEDCILLVNANDFVCSIYTNLSHEEVEKLCFATK